MRKEFTDIINKIFSNTIQMGLLQAVSTDESYDGKYITVQGKKLLHFGSCSYLGLETDQRLKQASIDAVNKYGTQFSSSRVFLQMELYDEVESMLGEIFGRPALLAPTTSLGHISTIPVLIDDRFAVIADQQVHNSVRNAIQMVKGDGVYVESLKHNRIDLLETRIQILKQDYEQVWYFADGVYSMFGDPANVHGIWQLLNRYEQFHVYYDDAHGMSWSGKNGRGYVLQNMPFHQNMILTTSLAKAFGNCGGVLVFNDEEQKQLIRNCGSSFLFSGPLQPAILGGIHAACKIHLSEEINQLQDDLFERMLFFIERAKQLNIPVVSNEMTPIFMVGTGKLEVGHKLSQYILEKGYFCNLTSFPAVPLKNSGIRIGLTRYQSIQDINNLLETIAEALPRFIEEEGYSYDEIYEAFNMQQSSGEEDSDSGVIRKIA